jgi:uncharacterized protein (DUF427 family)
MSARTLKIPGPDHPITIQPNPAKVIVRLNGQTIAETSESLTLSEGSYPPVTYIPRRDVDMSLLKRSDHQSYCPYKGDASYYSIPLGGERSVNAIWTYEQPFDAVGEIKDYMAFYHERVDSIEARDV